jgi:hypothetical protein
MVAVVCKAQQLPKSYYSKYHTPINNKKLYINLAVGYSIPKGIIHEQPSADAYLEAPFKAATGLGLKAGYEFEYTMKFVPGEEKNRYSNPRFMFLYAVDFSSHKTKWDDFSDDFKTSSFTFLSMGAGLELSYSLKDICVLSANYKIMGCFPFSMPGVEYTGGGYSYKVVPESDVPAGYFHSYTFGLRYRKHWFLNLQLKSANFKPNYVLTKKADDQYSNDDLYMTFPALFIYKTTSIQLGVNF